MPGLYIEPGRRIHSNRSHAFLEIAKCDRQPDLGFEPLAQGDWLFATEIDNILSFTSFWWEAGATEKVRHKWLSGINIVCNLIPLKAWNRNLMQRETWPHIGKSLRGSRKDVRRSYAGGMKAVQVVTTLTQHRHPGPTSSPVSLMRPPGNAVKHQVEIATFRTEIKLADYLVGRTE